MIYSQNNEQEVILDYLKEFKPELLTVIDIGANDGKTLSNTFALYELGAKCIYAEPDPNAFKKLLANCPDGNCINAAVGLTTGSSVLFSSDSHLTPDDTGLLSTTKESEMSRFPNQNFTPVPCELITFADLLDRTEITFVDFISIDAEGMDYEILTQINLRELGVKIVCIEHNSDIGLMDKIMQYCNMHGLSSNLLTNGENIIMAL